MAKAPKSQTPPKPRVNVRFSRVMLIIIGADLILMFAPVVGLLNTFLYIGEFVSFGATLVGLAIIIYAFQSIYYKEGEKK
ncbi:MAG: hypothetical protein HGB19_09535 [Chlorobiales bacterium]|jgi:hypothetical protein|nr:hypothetical protein [Chlorobiales bacterium]